MKKAELKKILKHLDNFFNKERELNNLSEGGISLYEIGGLGFIIDDLEDVLELQLGMEKDDSGYTDLTYFIHELDFGREYYEGCIEKDGKDIKLRSIDDFCDYVFGEDKEEKTESKSLSDDDLKDLFDELFTV